MSQSSSNLYQAGRLSSGFLFVSVAIVLLLLTGGGIYLAKQRSQTLSTNTAHEHQSHPVATHTPGQATNPAVPSPTTNQAPAATDKGTQTPSPSTPSPQLQQPQAVAPNLPSTGPTGILEGAITLTLLVFTGVYYARSRRLLGRLKS